MNYGVKPKYIKTDIGEIPEDWSLKTLSEVVEPARPICYGIVQTGRLVINGVKCIRVVDIENGHVPEDGLITTSKEISRSYARTILKSGDVIIALRGRIGASAVINDQLAGSNLTRGVALISPKAGVVSKYIYQYLSSTACGQILERNLNGSALKEIPIATLRKIPIPIPAKSEQLAISKTLSDIDALISGLDQVITKKRDIQQATMQQLLTGQRRLPGFIGKWKDGQFRDVVRSLESGVSVNSTDDLPEPSLPCILKTSALSGGHFLPNEAKVIIAADRKRACTNPRRNTVLISRMNTPALVGEIAYVEKDYNWLFLPDRLWMTQFISDDCVNVRWLAYLLSSRPYRRLLQDSATGTSGSMKNISKGVLLSLQISYPTIEEQTAIATILSDMDTELSTLETRRNKARQLKQGMMQELLTGRIRLA